MLDIAHNHYSPPWVNPVITTATTSCCRGFRTPGQPSLPPLIAAMGGREGGREGGGDIHDTQSIITETTIYNWHGRLRVPGQPSPPLQAAMGGSRHPVNNP